MHRKAEEEAHSRGIYVRRLGAPPGRRLGDNAAGRPPRPAQQAGASETCANVGRMQRVPFTGPEKESFQAPLARHRDAVIWKLEGLDEEQARRPMVPAGTSLLGLVKHL